MNVNTLLQMTRLAQLCWEFRRNKLDILGLSEVSFAKKLHGACFPIKMQCFNNTIFRHFELSQSECLEIWTRHSSKSQYHWFLPKSGSIDE